MCAPGGTCDVLAFGRDRPASAGTLQQADGPGGDALLATHEAQALGGGCGEAHLRGVDPHRLGHALPHGVAVRCELGRLRRDGAVAVHEAKSPLARKVRDPRQEDHAVRALVGWVGVREEPPYVAGAHGAEDGVHERVGDDVGIGVALEPALRGDVHPAEDEGAPLGERVDVKPMADPERHCTSPPWGTTSSSPQPSDMSRRSMRAWAMT